MTPYDTLFARPEFEEEIFPAISSDAAAHGLDTWKTDDFLQLPATNAFLEKLSPAGMTDPSPVAGTAALAFHAYHFWKNGRHEIQVDEAALRAIVDPAYAPIGEWPLQSTHPAGYVSMPQNLVWARTEHATPEAVHGFFYATSPAAGDAQRLDVLLALGVRADRAGFTAIEITVPLPAPPPGHFGDIEAREDGEDFANILPGGEMRALHALTNAGEVLKLVSRVLHWHATASV